jgi:hypothetical protein
MRKGIRYGSPGTRPGVNFINTLPAAFVPGGLRQGGKNSSYQNKKKVILKGRKFSKKAGKSCHNKLKTRAFAYFYTLLHFFSTFAFFS